MENTATTTENVATEGKLKFCKFCGEKIPEDAVLCTKCGRQVEELKKTSSDTPNIVINNTSSNVNTNTNQVSVAAMNNGRAKNKWVALALCILLGYFGAHKFYEGKVGMGILYLFTGGLFFIGVIIDFFALLVKPNPYYV
ncbi:MAG: TM2 domain-containing protein [Clostridia bacterium]|nr:TM2 domain-containing protein [Clostridia bacterium]